MEAPWLHSRNEVKMDLQKEYQREVFRQYNRARRGQLEKGRVNRALGLLMSHTFVDKMRQYGTTYTHCNCPDYENRTIFCKHRIAFIINWRAIQAIQALQALQERLEKEPLATKLP